MGKAGEAGAWDRYARWALALVMVSVSAGCDVPSVPGSAAPAATLPEAAPTLLPSESARQPNLLTNGSFEANDGADPAGWTRDDVGARAQLDWSPAQAASGRRALRVQLDGETAAGWRQRVSGIDPEIRYRFRAWVNASSAAAASHGIELLWLDASSRPLGSTGALASVSGQWTEVTQHDIKPPPGAVAVDVLLRGYQPGTYDFDDVVLTRQDQSVYGLGTFPLGLWEPPRLNLLSNSSVEQRRGTGMHVPGEERQRVCVAPGQCNLPAFWNGEVKWGPATQRWERIDRREHVLQTELTGNGQADWWQVVPDVHPQRRYRLFARVFASNVAAGSHAVEVVWLDARGAELGKRSMSSTETAVWAVLELRALAPPPGTRAARVVLRGSQAGTYRFNNIYFALEGTNADQLRELREAGFTLAPAFSLESVPGRPSLDEVGAAGLKAFYRGIHLVAENDTEAQEISRKVSEVSTHPALSLYLGPDEPAWELYSCPRLGEQSGLCPETVISASQALRNADAPGRAAGHGVWLNHAPRGTLQAPDAFDYLTAFNPAADLVSMDVYPVPVGNGHVSLPDQGVASVGRYVDILYDRVVRERERQAKPIWMVLQGFGWEDLRWWSEEDGGETLIGHQGAALEVHWLDVDGHYVTEPGPDGAPERVVDVLQTDRPNTWREVTEQALQPPASARTAVVRLRAYGAGTFWFDDVGFRDETGAELLRNGSFERGADGLPEGWARGPGSPVGEQAWEASRARTGSRSVRMHLQANGLLEWVQHVPVRPGGRYRLSGALYSRVRPIWEETRFMAYDAIVHGARGLTWWGTHAIPADAELWGDIKRLVGELRQLTPALVAPATFRRLAAEPTAEGLRPNAALFQHGEELYLIATNPHARAARYTLRVDGPPLERAERLFEEGTVAWSDNTVRDDFAPYQVRVYRLRK